MKYGLLKFRRKTMNIGDYYQIYGMKRVYEEMGIQEKDIVYVDQYTMSEYDGDYIILPMTGFFDAFPIIHWLPISPRIIPVFLGFHCVDDKTLRHMADYKQFEPFGCRDEETMTKLRQYGIQAYMSGCMSLCIRRREKDPEEGKVFVVDADKDVLPFIPEGLRRKCEFISHMFKMDELTDEEAEAMEKRLAEETLLKYEKEATLVITSKMHCALPCLAMGIPVIYTRHVYDNRWAGMDKLLHIYTPQEYGNIDWNITGVEMEPLKAQMIEMGKRAVRQTEQRYGVMCDVSAYFEDRKKTVYFTGYRKSYLSDKQKADYFSGRTVEKNLLELIIRKRLPETNVIIWGAGDKGKWMYRRYKNDLDMCRSCIYVDRDREKVGKFLNGLPICGVEVLNAHSWSDTVIIVAANHYYEGAGHSIGCELIDSYHLQEGKNFFFLDILDVSGILNLADFASPQNWVDGF